MATSQAHLCNLHENEEMKHYQHPRSLPFLLPYSPPTKGKHCPDLTTIEQFCLQVEQNSVNSCFWLLLHNKVFVYICSYCHM